MSSSLGVDFPIIISLPPLSFPFKDLTYPSNSFFFKKIFSFYF